MPGIMEIYVTHAENHISNRVQNDKIHMVSRKRVELEVLQNVDESNLPIETKVAWYHAILHTSLFESIWLGASIRYKKLTPMNIARYIPDESQFDFKIPSELDNAPEPKKQTKRPPPKQQQPPTKSHKETATTTVRSIRPPSPKHDDDNASSSDASSSDTSTAAATPSQMALAAKLGRAPSYSEPTLPSKRFHVIPDLKGLNRQTGDDGAYRSSPAHGGRANGRGGSVRQSRKHVKGSAKYVKGSAVDSLKRATR